MNKQSYILISGKEYSIDFMAACSKSHEIDLGFMPGLKSLSLENIYDHTRMFWICDRSIHFDFSRLKVMCMVVDFFSIK